MNFEIPFGSKRSGERICVIFICSLPLYHLPLPLSKDTTCLIECATESFSNFFCCNYACQDPMPCQCMKLQKKKKKTIATLATGTTLLDFCSTLFYCFMRKKMLVDGTSVYKLISHGFHLKNKKQTKKPHWAGGSCPAQHDIQIARSRFSRS